MLWKHKDWGNYSSINTWRLDAKFLLQHQEFTINKMYTANVAQKCFLSGILVVLHSLMQLRGGMNAFSWEITIMYFDTEGWI